MVCIALHVLESSVELPWEKSEVKLNCYKVLYICLILGYLFTPMINKLLLAPHKYSG